MPPSAAPATTPAPSAVWPTATPFAAWLHHQLATALVAPDHAAPLSVTAADATAIGAPVRRFTGEVALDLALDTTPALRALQAPWVVAVDRTERPPGCLRWDADVDRYVRCEDGAPSWHRHAAWFAEARSPAASEILAGHVFAEHDGEDLLLAMRPAAVEDVGRVSWFRLSLRGHPARRTHRLRPEA